MSVAPRRRSLHLGVALLGALALASPPSHAKTKLVAGWLDREVKIDGELDEWREALVYFSGIDAFVAAFNDDRNLYLCLYSQNPELAEQIASDGLRVRIELKQLGEFVVHFPVGRSAPDDRTDRASKAPIALATDVIELELPGQRDRVIVSSDGQAGVAAGLSHRGSLVYELRIPLQKGESTPWALNLLPGDRVKLVIENPQVDSLAEEQAARGRHQGGSSFENQGSRGVYGSGRDPGWTGGVGAEQPFYTNRFVFLFKSRLELAKAP